MTEQEKKKKLAQLEEEWAKLRHKRRRHQFYLDGINRRMREVEKEMEKL